MFQRPSWLLSAWVFCAALAVAAPVAAQKEFSSANRKIGNAAVEYRDKTIHIVAAYYHSQRNHDSRWLLIESALSTTDNSIIKREHIALRTPQGREIPLATQSRIGEDVKRVEQLLQGRGAGAQGLGVSLEEVEEARLLGHERLKKSKHSRGPLGRNRADALA